MKRYTNTRPSLNEFVNKVAIILILTAMAFSIVQTVRACSHTYDNVYAAVSK